MEHRVLYDRVTDQFVGMRESDILDRLDYVWKLVNAKHHKSMTVNDLIKMFGMKECPAGNVPIVDKMNIHITTEHDYKFPELSCEVQPVMLLLYKYRPTYKALN